MLAKRPSFFRHGKQTLFGAHFGVGVVVELRVAHSREEHGVGPEAGLEGLFREGIAHLVNCVGSTDGVAVFNRVAEFFTHSRHDVHALTGDFRADSIAGKYCYFEVHCLKKFLNEFF